MKHEIPKRRKAMAAIFRVLFDAEPAEVSNVQAVGPCKDQFGFDAQRFVERVRPDFWIIYDGNTQHVGETLPEALGWFADDGGWDFRWTAKKAYEIGCAIAALRLSDAPIAYMDTRTALGICALKEEDFPALYALQGKRVRLVVVDDTEEAP